MTAWLIFLAYPRFCIRLHLRQDSSQKISGGAELFGAAIYLDFDRGVAVGGSNNFVRNAFDFLLGPLRTCDP